VQKMRRPRLLVPTHRNDAARPQGSSLCGATTTWVRERSAIH
jgi:hypothetical protein